MSSAHDALRTALLFAVVVASTGSSAAQSTPPRPEPTATLVATLPLSLEDCRRLALTHNLVLRAQRETLAAAGFLREAELGVFEPELVASAAEEYNNRKNTVEQTISQGTTAFEEKNKLYSAGLEGFAPTGARYNIGYSVRDLNNNLRVLPTDPYRRQFQSFLGVTLTQPLLKDMGFSSSMARLRLAREDEAIARQEFRRQMLVVLGSVESVYWDLYVAQERVKLRHSSVEAAGRLLGENKSRVQEGKMAEIELVEAEAGLAQRRSAASEAMQHLIGVSGQMRTLFAEPVDQPNFVLRASDGPEEAAPLPSLDEALSDSTALHPEYLARLHRAEQEKVRVAYARNQRWPQIDLKASYGQNGLGDDYQGAWSDIDSRDHDSWSVGVEMRLPILMGVRQRNTVKAAKAHARESLLNLKAAEVEIANNIFTAQRKVESLRGVATDYEEVANAGERLLQNEISRLGEGKTDSRRLLEVENQFSDAKIAALESRGEYEKARIEFEMAAGRLLKTRGVDLGDATGTKVPQTKPVALATATDTATSPMHLEPRKSARASTLRRLTMGLFLAVTVGAFAAAKPPATPTSVPGITEPVHDSLLSSPVAGSVQTIHFKEGDLVEAGAVILELDKALEELEVNRRRSVYESRAELEAAEHRAAVLQADYESTKRLFEKSKSVSKDEVDKRELEFKLAVGERERLTAAKEREGIELDIARQQLAYRKIVAPFAGVITDLRVDLGVACEPRQPVVRLVELKNVYFVADVAPALTAGLKPGREVKLQIEIGSGQREVRGTVEYLAPVVDPGSGLRRVKIVFENPGAEIAPGTVGRLELD